MNGVGFSGDFGHPMGSGTIFQSEGGGGDL
jgi:hypothetical protein